MIHHDKNHNGLYSMSRKTALYRVNILYPNVSSPIIHIQSVFHFTRSPIFLSENVHTITDNVSSMSSISPYLQVVHSVSVAIAHSYVCS